MRAGLAADRRGDASLTRFDDCGLSIARYVEEERVQLIFVGARFDESRMFDLLDYIQKDAKHKKIPIVAAIIAVLSMSFETVRGNPAENARIRIIVDALLLPPDVVPGVAERLSP